MKAPGGERVQSYLLDQFFVCDGIVGVGGVSRHVVFLKGTGEGLDLPVTMPMDSAEVVENVVRSLVAARSRVWPGAPPLSVSRLLLG